MGKLIDYCEVRSGHPFRGTVPEEKNGVAVTVQMRDVDPVKGVAWETAARTSPNGRKVPDWLRPDDILFLSRGVYNYAIYLDRVAEKAICSQYFFVVRVKDERLLPAFVAWQINQATAQAYLRNNAEGSDQQSIRRAVLEGVPLVIPSLAQQRQLLRLTQTAQEERAQLENLIRNREREVQSIVARVLASVSESTNP
jgi:hypothetical protein